MNNEELHELVKLMNEYGYAKFGDEWWPGNASAWLSEQKAERLRQLAERA